MKLIALDIYFKLHDLQVPNQVPVQVLNQVPILFKITFKSLSQVLENIIIGKIIY